MWSKNTEDRLIALLEALYRKAESFWAAGNKKMYFETGNTIRRVEMALDRIKIGRVR